MTVTRPSSLIGRDFAITGCLLSDSEQLEALERLTFFCQVKNISLTIAKDIKSFIYSMHFFKELDICQAH